MRLSELTGLSEEALRSTRDFFSGLTTPTVRLGVTGLARAGKTVFITTLIRNLLQGGRLPFFSPLAEGRVLAAYLEPQPDDAVPRFDYEAHLAALTRPVPEWPDSTRNISELRLTILFNSGAPLWSALGPHKLHVDMVDYPGEWLLDLGLLDLSYAAWSRQSVTLAREPARTSAAGRWLGVLASLDAKARDDEDVAREAAHVFTGYLHRLREQGTGVSTIGPGRFLMPGDLERSPLLTFAPLDLQHGELIARGSLAAMMERRYESYKAHVVTPFFRDHFSRLDRQIVLVDALAALNGGAAAVDDLARALEASLRAFRPGARSWLSSIFARRIDRILFAATKADHLAQSSHDRLEAVLRVIVERAAERAAFAGAEIKVLALAALRATREAEARHGRERLACIRGVPLPGERIGSVVFDGRTEATVFPGDLAADPREALDAARRGERILPVRFVRFRPPRLDEQNGMIEPAPWPHIRLDRALEFLLGDRLA